MLFRDTLFLSILFTSVTVSAVNLGPLLAARAECPQCTDVLALLDSGTCAAACICSQATIDLVSQCIQCGEAAGVVEPVSLPTIENDCAKAGYPVTAGGSGGGAATASPATATDAVGGGGGGTATASPATATGAVSGDSTTTAAGGQSTAAGITFGKSSATGLTAQLGAVAAAVGGVFILAA